MNQMNQMNRMRFALFCDRAYSLTIVATVVAHALETMVEVEVARGVVAAAVVRRRTPKVAVGAGIVERRPAAVARSRKENATAVRSYNL